jgi:hypothetical protein
MAQPQEKWRHHGNQQKRREENSPENGTATRTMASPRQK